MAHYSLGVTTEAWLTLLVTLGVLGFLIRGRTSPAVIVFGGVLVLLVLGVIDTSEALGGFSNPAPITVAALYVLAGAVEKTGALTPLLQSTMGDKGTIRMPLLRTLGPTAGASAFLNNTPIVAMMIPQAASWAARRGISVSKFLMPISFAAVLGGTITLIGTSTNLVVAGQMEVSGLEPIGFFEIGAIGLPLTVVGLALIIAIAPRVLPARKSLMDEFTEDAKRFSVEMIVEPDGRVDGKTVTQARLRHLNGVFLASVDRGDTVIAPVRPETVLRGGNRLHFVGRAGNVVDLQEMPGLRSAELEHVLDMESPSVSYFEAVVGSRSPLVGKTLAEVGFRSSYQAAVVAIHRDGQLVDAQFGQVALRVGDTLILVSDPDFRERWADRADFLLVAPMAGKPPKATKRAWIPVVALAAVILLAAFGILDILQGALIAAIAVVVLGVLTPLEARRAVDLEVIVVIASAFGLAAAMSSSGLADVVANGLVDTFDWLGPRGVLLGIVIATVLITEMITNNAAALLMLPIAIAASAAVGLDPRGAAIAVAVMASASFLTPIGYQTNTMVMGPGGYRFTDYVRLGLPLTLTAVVLVVLLVPVVWSG
ncbi:MAG: SLC13 family permease [Actinomycetia bacterium]|nr:SLC13 family permease [Actinomycetes bacterium]